MKSLIKGILLGILLITAISAVTVYRIRDIQGDKVGDPTLKQELINRYTKPTADTTFVKVSDGWQLRDSIYFKEEVNYKVGQSSLAKEVNAISTYDYVFPVGANFYGIVNTLAYADGRDIYCLYYLEKKDTITAVDWGQGTQGVYTADAYNGIALYSVNTSSGLLTKIDSTANDGAIWKGTANTLQTKTLTKTNILNPGVYAVGFVYNTSAPTTAPTIMNFAGGESSYINILFPNNIKLCGYIGPTATNLPHTVNMSAMTKYNAIPYVLLR